MQTFVKEPLLHFLILGALLFGGYELINGDEEPDAGQIVVTQGRIDTLQASFKLVWQRPPTPSELDGLIQNYIREEVLAREAITLGLDLDDTVIRRRLRQKMEFIANDLVPPPEPTEAELEAFLADHSDLFRIKPRFTFRQIYLNPGQRGTALQREITTLLTKLNRPGVRADFRVLGDAIMLNPELVDVSTDEITRQFGDAFTGQLAALPTGQWQGPVTSGYGVHLVFVASRTPGKIPELASVRDAVAREWAEARRREDKEQFYQKLLKRYVVTIERPSSSAEATATAAQMN